MAERFLPHIGITLIFVMFMGIAALTMFFGIFIIAIPCWIVCCVLVGLQVRERKYFQVKDVDTAFKAKNKSGYGVTYEGQDAMREHLKIYPGDYDVALTLARSLSRYKPNDEGKKYYELAAKGALHKDMKLAVDILKEYLAKYIKPFNHKLTYHLSLTSEQYGDSHFATQGLESIFNDPTAGPDVKQNALIECVRICRAIGLDDAAHMYEKCLNK